MSFLPSGWGCQKSLSLISGVDAGANYQIIVKAYFGSGADGTEVLNGETVAKFYCSSKCKTDFSDIRFLPTTSATPYTYLLCSKVNENWAVFAVKITEDLDSNQTIRAIYGNPNATDQSSNSTFNGVVGNVVFAAPMNESDAEVNPAVIADDNQAAFWFKSNSNWVLSNDTEHKQVGVDCLKIDKANSGAGFIESYPTVTDWTTKNLVRFCLAGANTGDTIKIIVFSNWSNYAQYTFVDDFCGQKQFAVPYSLFAVSGTMNWASVARVWLHFVNSTNAIYYFDRLVIDVGVPILDFSGNGNNGAAKGTNVVLGKYVGKNARQFNLGDYADVGSPTVLNPPDPSVFSLIAIVKPTSLSEVARLISKESHYEMFILTSGVVQVEVNNQNTIISTDTVALNQYNLIVYTYNKNASSGKSKLYVNSATPTTSDATDGEVSSGAENLEIGARFGGTNQRFAGTNVFAAIVRGELSAGDVEALLDGCYPDVSLVAGSICMRKWALTELPSFGQWGAEENFVTDTLTISDAKRVNKSVKTIDEINLETYTNRDKLLKIADLLSTDECAVTPTRLIGILDNLGVNDINKVQKILVLNDYADAADNVAKVKNTRIYLMIGDLAIQITS
jgi:hypothetical protein